MAKGTAATPDEAVLKKSLQKLQDWVRRGQPGAKFGEPRYLEEEKAWILEAYLPDDEDEEFLGLLAARETDLLVEQGVCICMVTLPLTAYSVD